MKTRRIVITGGPGSGKTSLINYLEKEGYHVMEEISRDVTLQAKREGIDQLFLEKPILFSEKLLEGRLKQYHEGKKCVSDILFYDRGMPDVTAYMDFVNTDYPDYFSKTCIENRYDEIFVLPPWKDIYQQDDVRYESFEQAEKIFHFLRNGYKGYGYKIHEVPVGSIEERANYILKSLN